LSNGRTIFLNHDDDVLLNKRSFQNNKRETIMQVSRKLFAEKGYEKTSVRELVEAAETSMGNLYFHFPNKLEILKVICKEFVNRLRQQIYKIHEMDFSPETGFALDFKIGYITTLEHPKTSRFWSASRNIPEIHKYSLENKRIRLQTFFGDRLHPGETELLAIAIQGIADGIFEQKRQGRVSGDSPVLSNTIIDYSLRLLGYSAAEITKAITDMDNYIKNNPEIIDRYFLI
jgi:AcrR family transcriptional regulator